jgi:hypothetical protein
MTFCICNNASNVCSGTLTHVYYAGEAEHHREPAQGSDSVRPARGADPRDPPPEDRQQLLGHYWAHTPGNPTCSAGPPTSADVFITPTSADAADVFVTPNFLVFFLRKVRPPTNLGHYPHYPTN